MTKKMRNIRTCVICVCAIVLIFLSELVFVLIVSHTMLFKELICAPFYTPTDYAAMGIFGAVCAFIGSTLWNWWDKRK